MTNPTKSNYFAVRLILKVINNLETAIMEVMYAGEKGSEKAGWISWLTDQPTEWKNFRELPQAQKTLLLNKEWLVLKNEDFIKFAKTMNWQIFFKKCPECQDTGYTPLLSFYYPCTRCRPHETGSFTFKEIQKRVKK